METNTYKEILQQPIVWQEQYVAMVAQKQAIQDFLQKYLTNETEVVLTGAGTSAFIGDAIAPVLRPFWKNVRAVATTDLITHTSTFLDADKPLLLISFARSGNSPESVGTINLVNKWCKNVAHIYITCNKEGQLAQTATQDNVLCLLLPDATNDKSLAMTSSFSTMLLSCLLLSRIDTIEQEHEAVKYIIQNAQYVLEHSEQLKAIGNRHFERAIFLGSGPMKGIAEECHLKLQELTDGAVVCKFDTFLGFRHGPKAVVNNKSIMVYLTSDEEEVQRYERDLIKQVDANNRLVAQVIVSSGKTVTVNGVREDLQMQMPFGTDKTGIYGLLPYVLVGQLLGFYASISHGLCPDTPSVSGNISRVVEGVTIYE